MSRDTDNITDDSVDFLNFLDGLNPEQAESILMGINKITSCSPDMVSLRAKVLAKVGLEELRKPQEPESKAGIGKWNMHSRNKNIMRRAVACIAAVMTCSIVAIAATNVDAVKRFFGNDTEVYSGITLETVQSVENENVKVNIEAIVSDNYQCVFVLSMEAITQEGRNIIKNANKDISSALEISPTVLDDDEIENCIGIFQYTDDNKNKNYKAYQCDFELENVDTTKPVTVEFDGLTMKFEIPKFMHIKRLYPEAKPGLGSVDLSPIGYYYKDNELAMDVRLIKNDGTLDDELGYNGSMSQENNEEVLVIGSFTRIIDLNDYLGIQINGVNYTERK